VYAAAAPAVSDQANGPNARTSQTADRRADEDIMRKWILRFPVHRPRVYLYGLVPRIRGFQNSALRE
jgi:hypothetical protein